MKFMKLERKIINKMKSDIQKEKCIFTYDITDTLNCSTDGKFDDYGFPIHKCNKFPCNKYKDIINKK